MHIILLIIFVFSLLIGPQWWASRTMKRYQKEIESMPGTGGELAQHLIEQYKLDVKLETTELGDHYDPDSRTVRLSPANYNRKSLTAIAVAAHEVGHAMQHARNEPLFNRRTQLARFAIFAQKAGSATLLMIPLIGGILRLPSISIIMAAAGFGTMLIASLVHLITLPVEWDASFGKAMPVLRQGQYINQKQEKAVRKILQAAALTYVAGSLASMLNLWRWIAIFRRR